MFSSSLDLVLSLTGRWAFTVSHSFLQTKREQYDSC